MDFIQHFFIDLGILLIICVNQNCKANNVVECPNLPITPYPPVQTSNPTMPVILGTAQPTRPCQTICSQNSPNICPVVCPGTMQLINPCQINCIQNPSVSTNICQTACVQVPPNPCQIVCGQNPCQTTPTIPPTTSAPPTLPPPNIIKCPPGTVLIGEDCHVIYCSPGSVMKNNRCVFLECPEGTVWTGHSCTVPEPIVQNVAFNSSITTYINQTTPNIVINSTKNIVLNLPITINQNNSNDLNCNSNDYENCDAETTEETIATTTTTTSTQNCCQVMTPRICEERNNRWHCYSRRSHRCGAFCIAPVIYLKPTRIHAKPKYVILPPIQTECNIYDTCGGAKIGGHDCSGCAINNMSRCSYYCYRYPCPSHKCQFFDHQKYCSSSEVDMFGCHEVDGCYGDWCRND